MRGVIHVITGLQVGGAETMLSQIAPALAAKGLPQHVVSLTGDGAMGKRLRAEGIDVTCLNLASWPRWPWKLGRLTSLLRRLDPIALQGWMYHGDLVAAVAHGCVRRRGRHLYWGVRCSNMNLADYDRSLRWVIRACARLSSFPDAVIANSQAGVQTHRDAGYKPKRFLVIPNGIDTGRFRPDPEARSQIRTELAIAAATPIVIHVSRVDPMKDHPTFLKAMEQVPNAMGVLVGKDTETLVLPKNVRALGIRDDIPRLLAAADLVVSSSAYGEGFSNVIAEGMATGLPAIATDVGDARTIVGDTGGIAEPRNPIALATAINRLLNETPQLHARRANAARSRIASEFSLARAADQFEVLYRGG
jgi:glycosyltransferase involved in cell wall biosynthesis